MISSEQTFKKFQQKFQEFSNTELDKIDNECKAKIQDLLAFQTEYFIECGNEMVNEMFEEFKKLIQKRLKEYEGMYLAPTFLQNSIDSACIKLLEGIMNELEGKRNNAD